MKSDKDSLVLQNKRVLETITLCTKSLDYHYIGKGFTDLSRLKINLNDYIREVTKLFKSNEDDLGYYDSILNNLVTILKGCNENEQVYIDKYIRFLKVYCNVWKAKDIKALYRRKCFFFIDGFEPMKVCLTLRTTEFTFNNITYEFSGYERVVYINDKKSHIRGIFLKDKGMEIWNDNLEVLKRAIKNQDSYDYAIVCPTQKETIESMYEGYGIDEINDSEILKLMYLLEQEDFHTISHIVEPCRYLYRRNSKILVRLFKNLYKVRDFGLKNGILVILVYTLSRAYDRNEIDREYESEIVSILQSLEGVLDEREWGIGKWLDFADGKIYKEDFKSDIINLKIRSRGKR